MWILESCHQGSWLGLRRETDFSSDACLGGSCGDGAIEVVVFEVTVWMIVYVLGGAFRQDVQENWLAESVQIDFFSRRIDPQRMPTLSGKRSLMF